ncbi:MAG TPA: Stk1 family PASTA domain-containing Ser/Thr kinase [Actinomycetota bacterium]|nr:Stk1 family PASTA domain-containing Ser/Thr kinase [Actinomycetota bacterium]
MIETTVDGRYQVIARLASGGMGEVYRALDPVLGREVAIKVLHPSLAGDPGFIDRFRREARAAAMLSHPNIVAVHDWGEAETTYFMVMEFVRGPNLRSILMRDGPLEPLQAAEVVSGVLSALEQAHREGIVHRDVKPENVMLTTDGGVKVADFGLARALADSRISHAPGTVTGTVQYLAPEQIEGEPADRRTDLYATGIVLYELLTGVVPFTGETSVAVAYKHLRERVPPPSRSNPMVPPSLDRVVLAATERDRERRTPDATTMRRDLERAKDELPPAPPLSELAASVAPADEVPPDRLATVTIPRPLTPKARRRRRFRWVWTTLSVLAVLAVAGWAVWTYVIPHRTRVPNVEGLRLAAAQRIAEQSRLELQVVRDEYSSTVAANRIIRQLLDPGSELEEGSSLRVVVSLGPEFVPVPEVTGMELAAARKTIRDARLEVGGIQRTYHDTVPAGHVIEQNPQQGTQLEVGEPVGLTISRGEEPVVVPGVVGLSEDEAASLIQGAGLGVAVVEQFSATVPRGDVVGQEPAADAEVRRGTTVTIVVSKGPRRFPMPNVVGMSKSSATAQLEGLGLTVRAVSLPGSSGSTVVGQRPAPDRTVEQGQEVTIYVGGG